MGDLRFLQIFYHHSIFKYGDVFLLIFGFNKTIALINYTYILFCPFEFRFMFSLSRVISAMVKESRNYENFVCVYKC